MINSYKIKLKDKYSGVYIKTGNQKKIKNMWHTEVVCPHCYKNRFVRSKLLSENNKQALKSSLCIKCNGMSEQLFNTDNIDECYTIINDQKVYVDYEDIDKIKYFDLNISYNNYVEIMKHSNNDSSNYRGLLHRFLLNVTDDNQVVDHINHNTLDNRKENLRICTPSNNGTNLKLPIHNTTGFKNINISHEDGRIQKWVVQFIRNKKKQLKRFYSFIDAYSYLKEQCNSDFEYELLQDELCELRFAGLQKCDVNNGVGVGITLFLQYCSHHCTGCQNPQTWDKHGGSIFNKEIYDDLFKSLSASYITRLTLSGGDPLDNLKISNYVAAEFKYRFPHKKLWIYTGYSYETIRGEDKYQALLELCDVLVDGRFEEDKKDLTLRFRGSSNQRIIDVQKSLEKGEVVLWDTF